MSWGIRITILYVAFVAMIGTLVFLTMREKVDLVADDYYQREINFQQQLDKQEAGLALSQQPTVQANASGLTVAFPSALATSGISGKVECYRPSDPTKDFQVDIHADSAGHQQIAREKFEQGLYTVRLNWNAQGKAYYHEFPVYIP